MSHWETPQRFPTRANPTRPQAEACGERTVLQDTALRLTRLTGVPIAAAPVVVCNAEHRLMAAEQLRAAGLKGATILLEPAGRNTAPAMPLAALLAHLEGGDPVLLVMPAGHGQRAARPGLRAYIPASD